MSIGLKFVELTADVLEKIFYKKLSIDPKLVELTADDDAVRISW